MLTTVLELLAVAALSAFAWFVWTPLPLLVAGVALLAASYRFEHGGKRP